MQAMQDQIKALFEEKELILAQFNEVRAGSQSRTAQPSAVGST